MFVTNLLTNLNTLVRDNLFTYISKAMGNEELRAYAKRIIIILPSVVTYARRDRESRVKTTRLKQFPSLRQTALKR